MILQQILTEKIQKAVQDLFDVTLEKVEFQATRREFEGDITVVIFPLLKLVKSNPVELGNKIGDYLVQNVTEVDRFNVVSGFLNIVISDAYYLNFFNGIKNADNFGFVAPKEDAKAIMVEFASPNTNKPLHLGHVRNILLGSSVAEIIKASGKKVYKTQIINDRGIHICKSMLAWQKFGNGETPETSGLKGDKLVGKYYVEFDKAYKSEISTLMAEGKSEEEAKKQAPMILEAQQMLLDWEAGKPEVVELWKTMNQWVYDGFAVTYKGLGVDFDSYYYESNTYLLGKEVVQFGLEKGIFEKDPDGSVWIDLTEEGLDRKIVLRSDGTAVYMTQDIGTAIQRVKDNPDVGGMVYTVGNEQDYHFKVLFLILKKLGFDWAEDLYHLSYGMVELPSGKMKSREGTVVDADDLIEEMTVTAKAISEELGKLEGYSEEEKAKLYVTIGMGALKYYMLKVDPRKGMMFNPEESVDFAGNTGPFIQYTYARIQSILRKAAFDLSQDVVVEIHEKEKELLKQIEAFPVVIQDAAKNHSPALVANYTYDLVKEYNSFYQTVSILGEEDEMKKIFRVQLSKKVGEVIKSAFGLLGINVPERM
ncbi:argS protein [Flavobacterium cauense R2A-7]|uniref:Arginine--tRNA ligase n=1 Tax=Flavobacterium cauense R2A-7 TaxID=1341154 RepID=V6S2W7_9FLAO|nr:arginine--tRNA ligase [Flavobacterium cauense]ESU20739.1 argS protein [Flavobacterium cauense R2A-7]KGO82891.1 arginyl-tRNA synthetase [Flavobacterium cauense R2A-7]TWI10835.1 arginyl-tRNA synthetase [Flavobacterium cauense R2A-7]